MDTNASQTDTTETETDTAPGPYEGDVPETVGIPEHVQEAAQAITADALIAVQTGQGFGGLAADPDTGPQVGADLRLALLEEQMAMVKSWIEERCRESAFPSPFVF